MTESNRSVEIKIDALQSRSLIICRHGKLLNYVYTQKSRSVFSEGICFHGDGSQTCQASYTITGNGGLRGIILMIIGGVTG